MQRAGRRTKMVKNRSDVYHSQMTDQDDDAHRRGGWREFGLKSGTIIAFMFGDELNLRVDAPTTQTRRFKALIGEFFRHEFRRAEPVGRAYEVDVRIERPDNGADIDVDRVAKAVLDALSGMVFHKGSLIDRLHVSKHAGARARVSVTARPLPERPVVVPPLAARRRGLEDA